MSELHPTIEYVKMARNEGINGNYDQCLQYYASAKQEAEAEISACRNIQEKERWNNLVNDIVKEEAEIRRIKKAFKDIQHLMNVDDMHRIGSAQIESDPVQNELQKSPIRRQLKPGEKRPSAKIKRNSVPPKSPKLNDKKRPSPLLLEPKHISPLDKPKNAPYSPNQAKGIKKSRSASDQPPDRQRQIQAYQDPPKEVPNIDDPLVQQIIDMGILCRSPNVEWDQIAGLVQIKRLLRQNLVILPLRPDICKGLLSPWRSVLFYGPPGTGKTFLAKAVATECRRTFFNITSATITSRFLGESEKLVEHLFRLAEQMAPSTVFFDEIDAIASQRGSGNEHEASRRMKAQLLTKLEGIDGMADSASVFVMAATNFPWDLDEALLRRFQKRIYIPLPDAEGRRAILQMQIGELTDETFDFKKWTTRLEGYSCADISNLCRDAAQLVIDRKTRGLDTNEWLAMPVEEARVVIKNEDFGACLAKRKSSVDASALRKYEEWRRRKGAE